MPDEGFLRRWARRKTEARSSVEALPEYSEAVQQDQRIPQWAWDKFVRRQREKLLEAQADESRKRKDAPTADDARNRSRRSTSASAGAGAAQPESAKRIRRDDDSEPEEGEV